MCCYPVLVVYANWMVSKVKTREEKHKRSGAQMLNLEDDQQILPLAKVLSTGLFS